MIVYSSGTATNSTTVYAHDSEHGSANISLTLCSAPGFTLRATAYLNATEARETALALLAAAQALDDLEVEA